MQIRWGLKDSNGTVLNTDIYRAMIKTNTNIDDCIPPSLSQVDIR